MELKNKKILVVGLGINGGGVGTARYLTKQKARVTVTDLKTAQQLSPSIKSLEGLPINYVLGGHQEADFAENDLIIKNPGVPDDSPFLSIARKHNVPILMDINLFWQQCPSKKIIGITGTKGKTTTAYLVKNILDQANKKNVLAGNLGISFLEILPQIDKNTWVILELSSWQLEGLNQERSSPHISLITNIFPDHLNRYQSLEDYVAAKKIIFAYQKRTDYLLLNQDNDWTKKFSSQAPSQVRFFSATQVPDSWRKEVKLPGWHNLANIAGATKIGQILDINEAIIKEAVTNFTGLPHRLELAGQINRVHFYNDSAATNPAAAQAAIESINHPFVWLLGGADKNLDFSPLFQAAAQNKFLQGIVLLSGTATAKILTAINKYLPQSLPVIGPLDNFSLAVNSAYQATNQSAWVLLSPATASFGMFVNEFDRGNQFKKIVNDLEPKTTNR
jgi:UDP-N-acetylmuramoylalanine--D-glutamate ligase